MLRGEFATQQSNVEETVHDKHGYFNQYYKSSADWDFWLRCVFGGSKFKKCQDNLGVYYFNPNGMSTNTEHDSWKKQHEKEIFMTYLGKLQEQVAK